MTEMFGFSQKEDVETGFDMKNLSICTMDLFGAGTETTTTTLQWGLLYMIYYPHIQGVHGCTQLCGAKRKNITSS